MDSLKDYHKIPIKNLYYMLCYAWGHLEEKGLAKMARKDEKDLTHLLTRILIVKLRALIKRGFYREYMSAREETSTLRGKILFQESINTFSFKRAKMHCEFEEMSRDILHNQVIKSTLYDLLLSPNLDKELKKDLKGIYKYFEEIQFIKLDSRLFDSIKLHRSNQHYRFVLDLCRFLYESLLLHEDSSDSSFVDFERNPKSMARLFEDFVREFFKKELPSYRVKRDNIYWDAVGEQLSYLPMMQTDISLENDKEKWIIDTKYYQQTLQQNRGSEKVISGNLYQLFAYLNNYNKRQLNGKQLKGMLLYPRVGQDVDLSYVIRDYPIKICTVDLNSDWLVIEKRLLDIVS